MKKRPFSDLPYEILESLFKTANGANGNTYLLELLRDELITREDLESARLYGRVIQTLELLQPLVLIQTKEQ